MKIFAKPSPASPLQEDIINLLPHGSGINCDWQEKSNAKDSVTFSNSYQVMNGNTGGYVGFVDFSITLKKSDIGVVQMSPIKIHGKKSHSLSRYYDVRRYLDDLFADWFDALGYAYCV